MGTFYVKSKQRTFTTTHTSACLDSQMKGRKRERESSSMRWYSLRKISKGVGRSLKLFIGQIRVSWEQVATHGEVTVNWGPCPAAKKVEDKYNFTTAVYFI